MAKEICDQLCLLITHKETAQDSTENVVDWYNNTAKQLRFEKVLEISDEEQNED